MSSVIMSASCLCVHVARHGHLLVSLVAHRLGGRSAGSRVIVNNALVYVLQCRGRAAVRTACHKLLGQGNMCRHKRAPAMLASPAQNSSHLLHLQASSTGHGAYHDSALYVHGALALFESEASICDARLFLAIPGIVIVSGFCSLSSLEAELH